MLPEQPNEALVGTRPAGFISIRDAWLDLFQRLAKADGWEDLKGDERPQHTGLPEDERRAEATYDFWRDAMGRIERAVRRTSGSPELVVWTRQFPHQELEIIDLHRFPGWSEYSIASGTLLVSKNYDGKPNFYGWPLFVSERDWAEAVGQLIADGSRPSSKIGRAAKAKRPLPETDLTRWLSEFAAKPENEFVTQIQAWERIQKAFPKHSVSRDRVIGKLRELRPGVKPGPKPKPGEFPRN